MKVLIDRQIFTPPAPAAYQYQILTFDDGTTEYDAYCTQTTPILTAELRNGKAAKTEAGEWVAAPGPRTHYDFEHSISDFDVKLQIVGRDSEGKDLYDYYVLTPSGAEFYGDGVANVLHIPPHWQTERVAAEAIAWMCLSEEEMSDHPEFTPEQQAWVDSSERELCEAEICEWIEQYDHETAYIIYNPESGDVGVMQVKISLEDKIQNTAEIYQDRQVLWNQTGLILHLLEESNHISWDDIENYYPNVDEMDGEKAAEYINNEMDGDWKSLVCSAMHTGGDEPIFGCETADGIVESSNLTPDLLSDQDIDILREYIRNNANSQEIFEWYLVTEWLHDELRDLGEPVVSDGQSYWWGRTCTGQLILMDGTLQKIAAKYADYL